MMFPQQVSVQSALLTASNATSMVLESVMLVNVKLVTYNKQAKQRALSASISVLSAVPMISESVSNVEELASKTLQVSV